MRYAAALMLSAFATTANAATFTIRPTDAKSEGLNDTTPFTPVGGNNATTLGQARMNVLVEAARVWGTLLQSNVPILVDASFDPLTCTALSGTLGSAGPRSVFRNIGGAASPDIYYVSALADAISGSNRSSDPNSSDINAVFSSTLDSDSSCLNGRGFYYGLDHNKGAKFDLLLVVLHEMGHGLGFTSQVDLTTGAGFKGGDSIERFDSYTYKVFDEQFGSAWPALTDAQRVQSATHTGALAWNGASVNSQAIRFTQGVTPGGRVRLNAPATLSPGSSVSHWDSAVTPSILMEPNLPSLISASSTDITVCALQDVGWTVSQCPHYVNNRAPTASSQSLTLTEDTARVITLYGADSDSDPLTFSIATAPTRGTLSEISTTIPHTVVYTPSANENGSDSFTITVSDGAMTAGATISLAISAVNDAPTTTDSSLTAITGQSTPIVLAATDVDGDALTYTVLSTPLHGTLSGSGATINYQSTSGYIGPDSFTFRVNDGIVSSSDAAVTIAVQNPPPASGSSGGSISVLWVLLMALLASLRQHLQSRRQRIDHRLRA